MDRDRKPLQRSALGKQPLKASFEGRSAASLRVASDLTRRSLTFVRIFGSEVRIDVW
ncbi:MAG: hypothetical protein SWY16_11070 [Cyanobacteriota bacterium]|nr:hypothetical protein [Cyanobacteriota bacterium]